MTKLRFIRLPAFGFRLSGALLLLALPVRATTLTDGLAVYLNFDNNLLAQAGTTNHGQLYTGGATNGPRYVRGKIGSAASFRNTQSGGQPTDWALQLGDLEWLYAGSFSFAVWVKTAATWNGVLLGNNDWSGEDVGWILNHTSPKFLHYLASGAPRHDIGGGDFRDGNWHHVAAVFDRAANTVTTYLDGTASATDSLGVTGSESLTPPALRNTLVGGSGNGTYSGAADLDDLGIWNRALADAEIAEIYAKGLTGLDLTQELSAPPPPAPPTLGPYVRFTGPDSALVLFETATEQSSVVEFGETPALGRRATDSTLTTNHAVALTGLKPKTLYHFAVNRPNGGAPGRRGLLSFETDYNYTTAALTNRSPYPDDAQSALCASVAQAVLDATGLTKGYALDYDCGDGRLAVELARRSELNVVGVTPDAAAADHARRRLQAARLYGPRVTIICAPLDQLPHTKDCFNLIVSSTALLGTNRSGTAAELFRVLRPNGGVALLGLPPAVAGSLPNWGQLADWVGRGVPANAAIVQTDPDRMVEVTRAPLPGSGEWSHAYGEAGATACSHDTRVRASGMRAQWFGDPGPRGFADRGDLDSPPLTVNGYFYAQGHNRVFGMDAYNGRILWELEIPNLHRVNLPRDTSNMCADRDSLYLAVGNRCWRLAAYTGQLLQSYPLPAGVSGAWGYVACVSNRLYGTSVKRGSSYVNSLPPDPGSPEGPASSYDTTLPNVTAKVCSDSLFCCAPADGAPLWVHADGVIVNSTLAIGGGRIYFVDSRNRALAGRATGRIPAAGLWMSNNLVALDAATGARLWQRPLTITTSNSPVVLFLSYAQEKLVLNDSTSRYYLTGFSAADGAPLWAQNHAWLRNNHGSHMYHTVIAGTNVIVEPCVYDLTTGNLLRSGLALRPGCSTMGAAEHTAHYCVAYNTSAVQLWDLDGDQGGRREIAGMRASCWLSLISGGGLVLMPATSTGCTCAIPLQPSIAFIGPEGR